MGKLNLTALVSLFARAYHFNTNTSNWIFKDDVSSLLLSNEEYTSLSMNFQNGIHFFEPTFCGTNEEALRHIVDYQLSPSVLARSICCEFLLEHQYKVGCRQYVLYGSGYDSFAQRNKHEDLHIFEVDREDVIDDKILSFQRANLPLNKSTFIKCDFTNKEWLLNFKANNNYDSKSQSFNALLGLSYYLTKDEFKHFLKDLASIMSEGSELFFDYQTVMESKVTELNEKLASGTADVIKSKFMYKELESILEDCNLYIYEHLDNNEMDDRFFTTYNRRNPKRNLHAPIGVGYCLVVKKNNLY